MTLVLTFLAFALLFWLCLGTLVAAGYHASKGNMLGWLLAANGFPALVSLTVAVLNMLVA